MMRLQCYFLIGFILFNSTQISAQVERRFKDPMKNIIKMIIDDGMDVNDPTAAPSFSITFNSNDSLVYAIDEGQVNAITTVDNTFIVIIKEKDSIYAYSNLKKINIKVGDTINNSEVIGYADFNPDKNYYSLDLIITDGKDILRLKKKDFVPRL
jgi:hypothetical protein